MQASTSKLPPKPKPITGIRLHKQVASPTTSTKEKRAEPVEEPVSDDLNLTHASQSLSHPDPDLETWQSLYPGLSEDQVFKLVTRPEDSDWEIPDAVDAELADERLKLKYDRNQHINTTLLSSTSFSNPHIYAKLVDFVAIDDTASFFARGGWLTRQGIEAQIPRYGPAALSSVQRAKQEEKTRSQEPGKRQTIEFQRASGKDGRRERERGGESRERWKKRRG